MSPRDPDEKEVSTTRLRSRPRAYNNSPSAALCLNQFASGFAIDSSVPPTAEDRHARQLRRGRRAFADRGRLRWVRRLSSLSFYCHCTLLTSLGRTGNFSPSSDPQHATRSTSQTMSDEPERTSLSRPTRAMTAPSGFFPRRTPSGGSANASSSPRTAANGSGAGKRFAGRSWRSRCSCW